MGVHLLVSEVALYLDSEGGDAGVVQTQVLGRVQGYLAHKKKPTLLGPFEDPRHRPTVGFDGGASSCKRGRPVPGR